MESARPVDVSVIVVSYNSARCISDCVRSALEQEAVKLEVIVVDNASQDDTVQLLREMDGAVKVLANRENIGFGRACNQGFAASQGGFIYLLNPDARLVGRRALASLLQAMEAHAGWGMAGTRLVAASGQIAQPATSYPGQFAARNEFDRLPGRIAWVGGASMIVRRSVYDSLGGFDPAFFLHSEETDFCLRLRQKGHEIGYVDEVEVAHIGGASEAGQDPCETWMRRTDGLLLFWQKHYAAEDVVRLVRRDKWRAGYRMLLNKMLAGLGPSDSRAYQKYRRYQGTWNCCSKFLAAK